LIDNETGQRGAKPDSNMIKDTENILIGGKKDKCLEIIKASSEIYNIVNSSSTNPLGLDLSEIVDILFQN